jgi:hypothetical protein
MIKFLKMTKLVHNQVVGQRRGQKNNLVIKIEVAFFRTTPPPALCVAYRHPAKLKSVNFIEKIYFFVYENPSLFFDFEILFPIFPNPTDTNSSASEYYFKKWHQTILLVPP